MTVLFLANDASWVGVCVYQQVVLGSFSKLLSRVPLFVSAGQSLAGWLAGWFGAVSLSSQDCLVD